jgi:hypothetical protein
MNPYIYQEHLNQIRLVGAAGGRTTTELYLTASETMKCNCVAAANS